MVETLAEAKSQLTTLDCSPGIKTTLELILWETERLKAQINDTADVNQTLLDFVTHNEAQITLDEIPILLTQCLSATNDTNRLQLIEQFLANRDRRVTRTPIGYTAQPTSPANELCRKIAVAICDNTIEVADKGKTQKTQPNHRLYKLLMPSLNITDVYFPYAAHTDEDDLPPYNEVILGDDLLSGHEVNGIVTGKIIHVKSLIAPIDSMLALHLLFGCDVEKLDQISEKILSKKTKAAIQKELGRVKNKPTLSEITRIKDYYSEGPTMQYIKLLNKLVASAQFANVTIAVKLGKLINDLIESGDTNASQRQQNAEYAKYEQVGIAGLPATLGIIEFREWWNAMDLDQAEKARLLEHFSALRYIWPHQKTLGNCVEHTANLLTNQLGNFGHTPITLPSGATTDIYSYYPFVQQHDSSSSQEITTQRRAIIDDNTQGHDHISTYPESLLMIIAKRKYQAKDVFFHFFALLENNMRAVVLKDFLVNENQRLQSIGLSNQLIQLMNFTQNAIQETLITNLSKIINIVNFYVVILSTLQELHFTDKVPDETIRQIKNYIFSNHPNALTFKNIAEFSQLMQEASSFGLSHYNFAKHFINRLPQLFQTIQDCGYIGYFTQTQDQVSTVFLYLKNKRIIPSLAYLSAVIDHICYYDAKNPASNIANRKAQAYLYFIDIKNTLITTARDFPYLAKFIIQPTAGLSTTFGAATLDQLLTAENPEPVVRLFVQHYHLFPTFASLVAATQGYPLAWRQAVFMNETTESLVKKISNAEECKELKILSPEQIRVIFAQIKTQKNWNITDLQTATKEFSAEQRLAAFVGYAGGFRKLANWEYQLARIFNSKEDINLITASPELTYAMTQLINGTFAKVYEALHVLDANFRFFNPDFLEQIRKTNSLSPQDHPQQTLIALVLTHISTDKNSRSAKLWEIIGQHGNDNQVLFAKVHELARERQSKGLYYLWSREPLGVKNLAVEANLTHIERQAKAALCRM